EARVREESGGGSGHRSLLVVAALAAGAGLTWAFYHDAVMNPLLDRTVTAPTDEVIILSVTVGATVAMVLALGDKALGLGVLSQLSRRVTLMLIPPLVLIFMVLGTIFLGVATPTEGGAMGAAGALIMAGMRGRLKGSDMLTRALDQTALLTSFVIFILIG